ncbi:glycosyltransferase [Desulfosporosinus sp. HMP52]|uniref:glycosyltransferase n=1 Tax=Desulfosporosinus sp. HMP52 TaxID=1487923 RepID=UPI0005534452|nr:glycosyltransferase [Desulfosporosinus sp. HMP52]
MKVALVGRVAEHVELFDGQTVKTRNLYELLKDIHNVESVMLVDTCEYKKHIIRVLIQSIIALQKCDMIILCVAINGRRFFFPFFYYLNKFFKKDIYHSLIGGSLANNIEQHPRWKEYVNSFKINWVESHELVEDLKSLGVNNGAYLPNFKKINAIKDVEITPYVRYPYEFCTFSRVQEKKGITDAIEAINAINQDAGKILAKLDIYGPVDEDFKFSFNKYLMQYQYCVRYMGCIDADKSVETVRNYYMLLFPTRYYNEGIPGTIIDALAAGVPVIARRWHFCDEILANNVNGLVYEFEESESLVKTIRFAIEHPDEIFEMKFKCIQKAKEYMYNTVLEQVTDTLRGCYKEKINEGITGYSDT